MRTIAIAGVGLIGGSFGLALREAGFDGEILGVSSPAAIETAMARGAIDAAVTLEEAADRADLLYLSQPVDRIIQTIERLGNIARPDLLITDAGSTKTVIVCTAARSLPEGQFLGGHPLAGKEERGAAAADAGLFRGRPYVLTSSPAEWPHWREFQDWLERIGAKVIEMNADEHDRTVAFTSHLPQLLSTTLACTLARQKKGYFDLVFGPGLIDMTRLAMSEKEVWGSILSTNARALGEAMDSFLSNLVEIRKSIGTEGMGAAFDAANSFVSKIRNVQSSTGEN
jgi:prephenate dehydrogenase